MEKLKKFLKKRIELCEREIDDLLEKILNLERSKKKANVLKDREQVVRAKDEAYLEILKYIVEEIEEVK